uniref:Metalloendopeptidase n=1 Tax=Myripristis murdjan TaxID=586833 RepID=A0A667ZDM7_9TELE
MWLLLFIFICIVKVDGAPINDTHSAASPATVNGAPVNETHDVTVPGAGSDVSEFNETLTASAETMEELEHELPVTEGDLLLVEDRNAVLMLWPDISIPYTIGDELADRETSILAAFRMISDHTCIRFHRRTTELNYLQFLNGRGCASYVGCRGGGQPVYFARSCSVGNLCHEVIHALGLHHEHTRPDRDQYISVQWQSIKAGRKKNFKVKHGDTLNLPYDLDSIMHYGKYFFTADKTPTIMAKKGGAQMGQRIRLSPLDIKKLNRLYQCDKRTHLM